MSKNHNDHDHGHGHHGKPHDGDGDGTVTLPSPITFTLTARSQAIITVAFFGPLRKQIAIMDQTGFYRTYDSCMDGRRPYIVINNNSTADSVIYTITPSVYGNVCGTMQPGPMLDLTLKGGLDAVATGVNTRVIYCSYVPTNVPIYPTDQVGITITIQNEIGDLVP
jgi:hypothetical protein